jgi:hypothetical protein
MQFDQLTPEQQQAYLAFMLLVRPMMGQIENVQLWIKYLVTLWTSEILAIHNALASNAVIPDNTGYPNASPLTKAEVTAIKDLLQAIQTFNTAANSALSVKCVGPENIIAPPGI